MDNKYNLSEYIKLLMESPDSDSYWFGYYNYCPINRCGDKVLSHRWHSDDDERNFNSKDVIDIGWFSLADSQWHHIETSQAANWQQGAMTQWLNIDGEERIIFNDVHDGKYVSKIYNVDGSFYKMLPMAIYGINEEEQFSITIWGKCIFNFEKYLECR